MRGCGASGGVSLSGDACGDVHGGIIGMMKRAESNIHAE
jgi:hypothetical protein